MTVQQLFDLTIGMMGLTSTNASTYLETFIPQVNIILAQCFELENNVRTKNSLTKLTAIPEVTTLTDILTYQDRVLRKVLPWGLAQLLALSDDDTMKAGFFGLRYSDEYNRASYAIETEVTNFYEIAEDE